MVWISVLFATFCVIGFCAANPAFIQLGGENRIVGGYETTIEDNPWQVSLQFHSSHYCGGSIIGPEWILTAAHCTLGTESVENFSVRIGSPAHAAGGIIVQLSQYVVHPKYDEWRVDFDFALLKLNDSLILSDQIQPISLADLNEEIADGTMCRVTGWGETQHPDESNDFLRATNVPIVNQEYCNEQFKGFITPRMICAGFEEGGKDSCYGDSGGPLLVENDGNPRLVGLVLFGGYDCADPQYPGVYGRVSSVRDWIQTVTGI